MSNGTETVYFAQFEEMGEDAVRNWLNTVGDVNSRGQLRKDAAAKWLARFDRSAREQRDRDGAETLALNRKSADAAEKSAKAASDSAHYARHANIIALFALAAAVAALVLSGLALYLQF